MVGTHQDPLFKFGQLSGAALELLLLGLQLLHELLAVGVLIVVAGQELLVQRMVDDLLVLQLTVGVGVG